MLNLGCFPLPPCQKQRLGVQGGVMDAGELGLTHSGPIQAFLTPQESEVEHGQLLQTQTAPTPRKTL